jgi:hypothetical protein
MDNHQEKQSVPPAKLEKKEDFPKSFIPQYNKFAIDQPGIIGVPRYGIGIGRMRLEPQENNMRDKEVL